MNIKKHNVEQTFLFKVELSAIVQNKDYDEAMKRIMAELNLVNDGNIEIKKIEGSNPLPII